jgi:hypothetical protein
MQLSVSPFSCLSKRRDQEKETEIVTHVLVPPTHKPKFRCVRDLRSRENCEIAPKLDPRGGPPNARSRRFRGLREKNKQDG